MTSDQLLLAKVLSIINDKTDLNKDNIIQEIQEELKKQDQDLYERWKKVEFDVNHLFSQELTLSHIAARDGLKNVAKVLVAAGADVNKKEIPSLLSTKKLPKLHHKIKKYFQSTYCVAVYRL